MVLIQQLAARRAGPLHLVIGTTGHRDLREEDRPSLEARVRDIVVGLQTRYSNTPLTLLSPLAEGADRLVAQVALERGARLIVPLPMARAEYEEDFAAPASRAEFAALVERADECFVAPLPTGLDAGTTGEARDRRYANVGAYVVLHVQVLIALWDGRITNLVGGTAEIIRFQLEGVPEPYAPPRSPLDAPETGPVYHIVTPRLSSPDVDGLLSLRALFPRGYVDDAAAEAAFDRIYARIDTFNRDALALESRLTRARETSRDYLLPETEAAALPHALASARACYAVADALALHFQRLTLRTLHTLLGLVFLAALLFAVYDQVQDEVPEVWLLHGLALLIAYMVYRWARRREYEVKYLDYRALAEGLRVQFFWRLTGLSDSVARHYLRKQRSELDWIRNAVRVLGIAGDDTAEAPTAAERHGRPRLVLRHWVEDQAAYFARATRRDDRRRRRQTRMAQVFFLGGLGLATFAALLSIVPRPSRDILGLLIAIGSLASVSAALLRNYGQTLALAEHTKQYERMSRLFADAREQLEAAIDGGDDARARTLIEELGKEALAENGDWVLLHRERRIEVPDAR